MNTDNTEKTQSVEDYVAKVPLVARDKFDQLRSLVQKQLPAAKEVVSYGIIGYKMDEKRAKVFISGWKDHVAIYPIPKNQALESDLKPYKKGKGTLWFSLDQPLPERIIRQIVKELTK